MVCQIFFRGKYFSEVNICQGEYFAWLNIFEGRIFVMIFFSGEIFSVSMVGHNDMPPRTPLKETRPMPPCSLSL